MPQKSNPKESFPIKAWNLNDRPREKLINKGERSLTDAELIAILIGSGTPKESAVVVSQRILAFAENNLQQLGKLSLDELQSFKGIGQAKAITIMAAMELGRRRREGTSVARDKVTSSQSVYHVMYPLIGELPHEEFWILYLNNSNRILQQVQLSKGGITGTLVDVRLVLKKAIQLGAVSIILAHNHPSGTLEPSQADRNLTRKLKEAGASLDIKVLDHLIITENAYFSFADSNAL